MRPVFGVLLNALPGLLAAAILLGALAAPKREVGDCIRVVKVTMLAQVALNCDSTAIARDVHNLHSYLHDPSPFRSRPAYIFSLAAVAHVGAPVLAPLGERLSRLIAVRVSHIHLHLAGIVFNAAIVALAYAVFCWIIDARELAERVAVAAFIASYDITVAWFWVLHQIVMNVLAPLGTVAAFLIGTRLLGFTPLQLAGLGAATAAGCLTYGFCLVWPVALVLGAFSRLFEPRASKAHAMRAVAIYSAVSMAPIAVWFGTYYLLGQQIAYEAQHVGQFSWLPAAIAEGRGLAVLGAQARVFVAAATGFLGWHGLIMAGLAAAVLAAATRRAGIGRILADPVLQAVLVTLLASLAFNFLQGYHRARLLLFPMLLTMLAIARGLEVADAAWLRAPALGAAALAQGALALLRPAVSLE